MKASIRLALALAAACAAAAAQADITIGVSIPLTGPTSALGIPSKNGIALWPTSIAGEKLNVIVLDDATDPTIARQERPPLHHRGQGRPDRRLGGDAARRGDVRRRRRRADGAADALAGEPASGQGRLVVPHAAVDRGDGDPDRRALEEDRGQDLRLPRLLRRLRRSLADRHPAAGREGRHQADRDRALRPARHQRHRPGAEARRGQSGRDPDRRLGQRRGDAAQGPGRARLSQGQALPDARRRDHGPDPRRRRRRRGLVRLLGPGGRRREAARPATPARRSA